MGWFEEQVKKREKLDAMSFEESFLSLAGIRSDSQAGLSDEEIRDNYAISQVLSYFSRSMVDIPKTITKFSDKLNYALGQYDIQYHKVELNDAYVNDGNSPLLIFTFLNNFPVVLFPKGNSKYYYINYQTGKKVFIDASLVNRIELEAYSFYRPLPDKKISMKEYAKYLFGCIRPLDIVLLLLFSVLATAVGLLLPYLTKLLTGDVAQSQNMNLFLSTSVYVAAAATGLVLLNSLKGYVNSRIAVKVEKEAQEATIMRLFSLPPSFFKKYNTGELTMRFNSVSQLANTVVTGIFTTLVSVVMSLAYLFQLQSFSSSFILPVVLILFVSTGFSVLSAFLQRKYRKRQLEVSSKEAGATYEMINGIQKIRLSGSEKRVFAKWAGMYAKEANVVYHPPLLLRLSPALTLFITLAGNVAIYYIAAANRIEAANYMAFVASFGVLSAAFASVTDMMGSAFTIRPLYEMASPILETEKESGQGKTVLESIQGNISLKNVSFRYEESGPLILDHLSLEIKEGEYVAIVGPSGCGKSTLIRLILGFEQPFEGDVSFDDINIRNVDLSSLRRNVGTVMQNGTLFHADILSNIIISCPTLSEEAAWAAAEIADIADDIKAMPMGMKTVISEGQGGISGGQKQRIMIARAIVHQPKVLIFDEATSALDNKTQKSITESINRLKCTRIVIAHRLSTIKNADRIIMLEGGKITEQGDYQTLIEKEGKFAELVARQRLDT